MWVWCITCLRWALVDLVLAMALQAYVAVFATGKLARNPVPFSANVFSDRGQGLP